MDGALKYRRKAELKYVLNCMKLCFSSKYQYLLKEPDTSGVIQPGRGVVRDISPLSLLMEFYNYKQTFNTLFHEYNLTKNQRKIVLYILNGRN